MKMTTPNNRWSKLSRTCSFTHVLTRTKAKDVINTKKREIENSEIHEVYICIPDMGQKCIST